MKNFPIKVHENVPPEVAERLMLLAVGVMKSGGYEFCMSDYRQPCRSIVRGNLGLMTSSGCGTAACLAGHGPHIKGLEPPSRFISTCQVNGEKPVALGVAWFSYANWLAGTTTGSPLGAWLFSGQWSAVDNTRVGAVARALFYLDNGRVPDGFKEIDILTFGNYRGYRQYLPVAAGLQHADIPVEFNPTNFLGVPDEQ